MNRSKILIVMVWQWPVNGKKIKGSCTADSAANSKLLRKTFTYCSKQADHSSL